MSFEDFRDRYLVASKRFDVPEPSDATVRSDYEAYLYGEGLIEKRKPRLRFYRDDQGELSWEVRPG